ncbi:MAG: 1-acyl-sn-glycerol-3-phosphate acyltransferase [Myxococcota bacterium]
MSASRRTAARLLALHGWKLGSDAPGIPKAVVIAAPHTSNWDGYYMVLCGLALGIQFAWIGKSALFVPPLGWIVRSVNGLPVDRSGNKDMVAQIAGHFQDREKLMLAIAPEGTRSYRPYWRSGFYHIAQAAKVPILKGFCDYGRKQVGIDPEPFEPTGDPVADMDVFREFYSKITPAVPKDYGPIRLKEEA